MRFFYALLALILVSGFFLNRSYASMYQKLEKNYLIRPASAGTYLFGEAASTTKRIKYIAIGDSLTAGVGTTHVKNTFPYILSEKMAQNGKNIELLNLGTPGAKTQDLIDLQLQKAISEDPNIVTLLIGTNDIKDFISADTFKKSIKTIIDELTQKTKASIVIITIPYLGANDLVTWPYNWLYRNKIVKFNTLLKQVAQDKGLTLIDLYNSTEDQSLNDQDYYSIDQFHPSADGYKQWSDIIYASTNF